MFAVSIISAIIIGLLLKGHLSNLKYLRIKSVFLIFASYGVELLAKMLIKGNIIEIGKISFILHLITYILIFIMLFKNRHSLGMQFIGGGTLLNAIVIFANGGMMPIGTYALRKLDIPLTSKVQGMYHITHEGTYFPYLGDILPVYLWKVGFILSLGDLLIMVGIILMIVQTMIRGEQVKEL